MLANESLNRAYEGLTRSAAAAQESKMFGRTQSASLQLHREDLDQLLNLLQRRAVCERPRSLIHESRGSVQ